MKTIMSFRASYLSFRAKSRNLILLAVIAGLTGNLLASCTKWTETQPAGITYLRPWDQNPELWEQYKASLLNYKQSDHFLFYARFENAPEKAASEKDFLRCLPDSLDFVSLTNAEHFSEFDKEDMAWMKSIGTKVLYHVDLDKKGFSDVAALNTYLDQVVGSVKENGLDGYAFTGSYRLGDALNESLSSALVAKLSAAKTEGQVLVFEGNPLFVPEESRSEVDYFVLDSETTAFAQDLHFQILSALDYAKVPASKLLLGADMDGTIQNEEREKCSAVEELTRRVVSFGPLAGLGIRNIKSDYYSYDGNYVTTRAAIQLLNPSH